MIQDFTYRKLQQIKSFLSTALCGFLLFFVGLTVQAQIWPADTITVKINFENPTFPFPQFLEYKSGKSLAANNAVGVTHADMEKAMREGYEIMMHRSLYTGAVLNDPITGKSVRYIYYNYLNTPEPGYEAWVSEGDGYALIAAAYFGDKATFDGIWCAMHDARMSAITRYIDCQPQRMNYPYGPGTVGWKIGNNDAAPDGDFDIAMGLFIAYKQWGPDMGINDKCGKMISYKEELKKYLKTITDTVFFDDNSCSAPSNPVPCNPRLINNGAMGYYTGDIGFDGFIKGANTTTEFTQWAKVNASNGFFSPETYPRYSQWKLNDGNGSAMFTDYIAPSYFNEFAKFLETEDPVAFRWNIHQFKRAEASSDWIVKQLYDQGYILSSGKADFNEATKKVTFGNYNIGEDFRLSWRTSLNYLWHGNPTTSFNINTHQVDAIANTYEKDMAIRHADFLKFPRTLPSSQANAVCSDLGLNPDRACPLWKGVVQIKQTHDITGNPLGGVVFRTNYAVGTGVTTAVASEDLDLTAELYRQCEILWDDVSKKDKGLTDDQRYVKSTPIYFHDWFRLLGMLTASGNLHAPSDVKAAANMKVYMAVDKTFAYEGDLITYTVDYRNYGSLAATGVKIVTTLDSDYEFVSAVGGVNSGNTITWNIGSVAGFKSGALAPTKGQVKFVVRVKANPMHPRVCLTSTITATNAPTWVSNEYPNNASYTMERNCVDLLKDRILAIEKTTDRTVMNQGDIVNFTLNFENKTGTNLWLNGGRDRVIISYANYIRNPVDATSFYQFYRIWHTAPEAYINLGNYRVSYFMNDPAAIGEYNATTNPTGWETFVDNQSDLDKYGYNPLTVPLNQQLKFSYQKIPYGTDANGSWNQRVITQFAQVLSAPSSHIFDKLDHMDYIHKGVVGPGFTRTRFESKPSSALGPRLEDDWSHSSALQTSALDGQAERFAPISPTYTNAATNFAPVVVNNYSKDICNPDVANYERVLVEEFDGYTWRRIAGRGPLPGRETYNVVVTDSIPIELQWSAFTDDVAVGVTATYTPLTGNPKFSGYVKWKIPVMMVGEKGDLSYKTIAKTLPVCVDKEFINTGWIWSDVDSPDSSTVKLKLSCTAVPPTPPIETSLVKTADKTNVVVGDVINYTLTYTNKDGSKASWKNTSTLESDWHALGLNTTIPDITGSTFTINNNNTSVDAGPNGFAFGHRKSHGKNGYTDITFTTYDKGTFSLVFRNKAGTTPGQPGFEGVRLEMIPSNPNVINFKVYNNNTLLQDIPNVAYPGSITSIKLRAQLVDDKLYIWINDFTGAPIKVIPGIKNLNAGFAGIFSATSAEQVFTNYSTHWDSAFDLILTDPVPTQLNTISSLDGGVLTGSTLTWPTVPGPILANADIVKTFSATVNTCADFITNIGKASVYGVTNIQSQYVVNCGSSTPPCTPPATPVITKDQTICTGTAPAQIGGAALAGGSSTGTASYIWQTSEDGTTNWMPVSGVLVKDYTPGVLTASAYYRRIDSKGGCSSLPSNVITITVTPAAIAGSISSDQEICYSTVATAFTGTISTGGVTIKNYKWQSSTTGKAPWNSVAAYRATGTGFAPGILTATTYYRRIDSSGACAPVATDTLVIRVNNKPILSKLIPQLRDTLCVGEDFNLSSTTKFTDSTGIHASVNGGYYFNWKKYHAGILQSTSGPLPYKKLFTTNQSAMLSDSGMYYLVVQDGIAATTCKDSIGLRIVINQGPISKGLISSHQEICKGDVALPFAEISAPSGYSASHVYQQWYTTIDTTSTGVLKKLAGVTTSTYTPGSPLLTQYYVRKDSVKFCSAIKTNHLKIRVNNSVLTDKIVPIENDTLCVSAGSMFQLKGVVDSSGRFSLNGGYYFTWEHYREGVLQATRGPVRYEDFPVTARAAVEKDSGMYYLIVRDGLGAVRCADTLKLKVVVYKDNCSIIPATCKKPILVTTKLAAGNDTLCVGTALHVSKDVIDTLLNPENGYYYSWRRMNAQGNTLLYGPSLAYADLTISSVTAADSGRYYLIVQDGLTAPASCTTSSAALSIVIDKPITTPAVLSKSDTICSGTAPDLFTELAASIGSTGTPYKYQWYSSVDSFKTIAGVSILAGAINKTYQGAIQTSTAYYMRVDSAGVCPKLATNILTIAMAPALIGGRINRDTTICKGGTVTITNKTAPTGGDGTLTYTWKKSINQGLSWTSLSGSLIENSETNVQDTTWYFREVSSCSATKQSDTIKVNIYNIKPGTIGFEAGKRDTVICTSGTIAIKGLTSPSGGKKPYSYTWERSTSLSGPYSQVSGIDSFYVANASALSAGTCYFRRMSHDVSSCSPAVSDTLKVEIKMGVSQTQNPLGQDTLKICPGTTQVLSAPTPTGGTDAPNYVYQWQLRTNGVYIDVLDSPFASYQPSSIIASDTMYRRRVVSGLTACDTAYIEVYMDFVDPLLAGSITPLSDTTICKGGKVHLNNQTLASGGRDMYTYSWKASTTKAGPYASVPGSGNVSSLLISNVQDTMWYFREVRNSCPGASQTDTIVVYVLDPSVSFTGTDPGPTCLAASAVNYSAKGSGGGTNPSYKWYVNSALQAGTTGSFAFTPAATPAPPRVDTIKVEYVSLEGCKATTKDTIQITTTIVPVVEITGDIKMCAIPGMPAKFKVTKKDGAGNAPTFDWYIGSATIPAQSGSLEKFTHQFTAADNGKAVYVIMTSNSPCASASNNTDVSNILTMELKDYPNPTISPGDTTICSDKNVTFTGAVTSGNTYQWYKNGMLISKATNVTYQTNEAGIYSLNEDNVLCSSSSSGVELKVIPQPQAYAGPDVYMKEGEAGNLNGSGGAGTVYNWTPNTYLDDATVLNPKFIATTTTNYVLTVTDALGKCKAFDDVTVFVMKPVKVPNVITVNGDGSNDDWEIENIEGYPNVIIEIYNRWGNLVWKTEGYPKNWDGTNFRNGQVLPDGTYFYIINLQNQVYDEPLTGWVQIIK